VIKGAATHLADFSPPIFNGSRTPQVQQQLQQSKIFLMRQQPLQAPVSRHTLPVQPALAAKLKNYDQAALNSSPQVIFKTRQQEGPPLFAKFSAAISRPPAFYNHFEALNIAFPESVTHPIVTVVIN
jgi:hypothetical protein